MSLIEQALRRMRSGVDPMAAPKDGVSPGRADGNDSGRVARSETTYGESRHGATGPEPVGEPERSVPVRLEQLRAAGLLPPEAFDRQVARQFRRIKLPIVDRIRPTAQDFDPRTCLVMVGSALPGDGKTFCATNLAFSMARERDTEALLVDADVAKPNVTAAFGMSGEAGLVDAIKDKAIDVESLVISTGIDGLRILPAGRFEEDSATELLSSSRMVEIAARLSLRGRRRRIVVFDTPPLLLTTEARVLSGLAGQIVLVVGADRTPREAVYAALDVIGADRPVGFVLNRSKHREGHATGSYYGYGGYGSYGKYGTYAAGHEQAVGDQDLSEKSP